ncbi:MAG: response regulator [Saprospiraceae bacterium]|nr:response regulator [Saprospiraceae bacterium]
MANILIVDDREYDRILYRELLGEGHHDFQEIDDGEQIASALETHKPDLILLDWQMPRMGGLDTLKFLKRSEEYKDIPVIIITGLQDERVLEEAFNFGGVDFINKPVSRIELNARVLSTLHLFDARKRLLQQKNELSELNEIITSQKEDLQETLKIRAELNKLKEQEYKREIEEKKRSMMTLEVNSTKIKNSLDKFKVQLKEFQDSVEDELDVEQIIKRVKKLEREMDEITSKQESWEDFKRMFESINPGFFQKLSKINPKLTTLDLKHCAYIKMNIDNFELSNILNVELKSLQMTRYRIKKKLDLEEGITLREFLMAIE